MLLQRLATGATGVKQARGPTRGSEVQRFAPKGHSTRMRSIINGAWHLLFNAWCTEFRRGFCTLVLSFVQSSLLQCTEGADFHELLGFC